MAFPRQNFGFKTNEQKQNGNNEAKNVCIGTLGSLYVKQNIITIKAVEVDSIVCCSIGMGCCVLVWVFVCVCVCVCVGFFFFSFYLLSVRSGFFTILFWNQMIDMRTCQ